MGAKWIGNVKLTILKYRKKIFAIRDGKVSLNKTQKAQNIKGKNDKILFIFNDKFKTFALQKMPLGK